MRMNVFNRVLERDNMTRLRGIDIAKNGCEGGGFTGTGSAGHEYQAGLFTRDLFDDFRELKPLEGRDNGVQLAQDDGIITTLRKDIDTEAGLVGQGVGGIAGTAAQEV